MGLMTAGLAADQFAVAEPVSREELDRPVAVQRGAFLAEGVPGAEVRKSRIDRLVLAILENAGVVGGVTGARLDPALVLARRDSFTHDWKD
jgi:hypothetical protein